MQESLEDREFLRVTRDWLAIHAPKHEVAAGMSLDAEVRLSQQWQQLKAEHGYAALCWPADVGGRGESPYRQAVFSDEERAYKLPMDVCHGGVDVVLPALFKFAPKALFEPLLEQTRMGKYLWSMLISEPDAGSDIAAMRLSARQESNGWILNGQKTWCSWARYSRFAVVFARTDTSVPSHRGLSGFVLDMESPGTAIQSIQFMYGEHHGFDDVFLSDVCVPLDNMIGKPGDGWKILLAMLGMDRFAAADQREVSGKNFWSVLRVAQACCGDAGRRIDDRDVRQKLADYYTDIRAVENLRTRLLSALAQGKEPGPEAAIGKLILANRLQELSRLAMDWAGPLGIADVQGAEAEMELVRQGLFMGAALRVGAGTDELIRNSIGERVLGLPPEPRSTS